MRQHSVGLWVDVKANAASLFGLFLPLALTLVFGTADYGRWLTTRAALQGAADGAALAAAKELRLGSLGSSSVTSTAQRWALVALSGNQDQAHVVATMPDQQSVKVEIDEVAPSLFGQLAPVAFTHLHVEAIARNSSTPTCLIALDSQGNGLKVKTAAINANGCGTYSNAAKPDGINIDHGSIEAIQTCTAGGVKLNQSILSPSAITDCPTVVDPLADRPAPPVGSCLTFPNLREGQPYQVVGGAQTLTPGTYCGGLKITKGAVVTLLPGVYVINGGKFSVDQSSHLSGDKVGFFLTGDAVLDFDLKSSVNLVAPADGPLAGILFFEDRGARLGSKHLLGSQDAPQLLGTLYFSRGTLNIGAPIAGPYQSQLQLDISTCYKLNQTYPCSPTASIAQYSAWTIILAREIAINFVLNLQLNTNYSANSTVPPEELSSKGATLWR